MPGTTVEVPWPRGWTSTDHLGNQVHSADPNDHYRPYLEEHVGKQGWDWDWRLGSFEHDSLRIKIRRKHEQHASIIVMKWARHW